MICSLLLLSASLVSTPVFISDVKAVREAGHLRVEVRGDGGIDPEGARTSIDDGRLIIYLGGTHVRADNRAWQLEDGAGEIRAHRHRTETELVVPLAGNGCAGPVELAGSPSGITALVGCEGTVTRTAATTPSARRGDKPARDDKRRDPTLAALVALPPADDKAAASSTGAWARPQQAAPDLRPAPTPVSTTAAGGATGTTASVDRAKAVAARATRTAELAAITAVPATMPTLAIEKLAAAPIPAPKSTTPISTSTSALALAPSAKSPARDSQAAMAAATMPTSAASSGGLRAVAIPALLLAGLAVAAFVFARRRRSPLDRRIQILETVSLGPKRSLVVARIGDETLILGTSEAGITLLKSSTVAVPLAQALAGELTAAELAPEEVVDLNQPIDEALADIPEPDAPPVVSRASFRAIEGGLVDLFGKRAAEAANRTRAHVSLADSDEFGEILEDSVEDQELRQKLAAGLSARVR